MIKIGRVLRILRNARGLHLGELASASNTSPSFLSLVEHGKRQPSLALLCRITDALAVPSEVMILLSQSGGTLRSSDKQVQGMIVAVEKLVRIEDSLKAVLGKKARR